MAKQTFTAGQVLTATQMNNLQANDYNWTTSAQTASYVLTAANAGQTVTMTSASATTITVNTSLFAAGDTVRILNLGAGATTITAGTATVNTAGSLVLPQYGSGTLWFSSASAAIFIPDDRNAGLTFISSTSIGTGVTSVAVSNCFSSTYVNYRVIVSNLDTSTGDQVMGFQLGSANTNYYSASRFFGYAGTTGNVDRNNQASAYLVASDVDNNTNFSFDIYQPNLTEFTTWAGTGFSWQYTTIFGGKHATAAAYTGFTLISTVGTFTGGTIKVYGYQNS